MMMQGRVVRSWMDYILVSDRRILQNVAVRNPRHNSDHLMVIGRLRVTPPKGTLALPWAHDAPPDMTARSSDEDAYGQDIF